MLRLVALLAATGFTAACHAQFIGLGILPGQTSSRATAISRDGSTIVGTSGTTGNSWRWRQVGGITPLPFAAGSSATLVCDDGGTIVALSVPGSVCTVTWLREGMAPMDLPGLRIPVVVMSGDGEYVFAPTTSRTGDRWDRFTGDQPLPPGPPLQGDGSHSYNGQFVPFQAQAADFQGVQAIGLGEARYCIPCCFGECNGSYPDNVDYYWSADNGTGPLPSSGGYIRSMVLDASLDLSAVLLYDSGAVSRMANGGAPVTLPQVTSSAAAPARISGDGSTVIAGSRVWDAAHSTRTITQVLDAAGLHHDGWSNLIVTGVDMRGVRMCGYGTDPHGATEAWLADLAGCGSADFNGDGDIGTDADIEAFFACLAGNCCPTCGSADFNNDGDLGTDADIEAFFRVLAGGSC